MPVASRYEGEWRSGLKHGHGKMVYANGDVYEGDWMDDQRAGLGVLTLGACLDFDGRARASPCSRRLGCVCVAANGDTYEGHWLADKKEGPGRYFYVSTRKMYEGEWVDDVAKCGVFSDIPIDAASEAGLPHPDDNIYKLPAVRCAGVSPRRLTPATHPLLLWYLVAPAHIERPGVGCGRGGGGGAILAGVPDCGRRLGARFIDRGRLDGGRNRPVAASVCDCRPRRHGRHHWCRLADCPGRAGECSPHVCSLLFRGHPSRAVDPPPRALYRRRRTWMRCSRT